MSTNGSLVPVVINLRNQGDNIAHFQGQLSLVLRLKVIQDFTARLHCRETHSNHRGRKRGRERERGREGGKEGERAIEGQRERGRGEGRRERESKRGKEGRQRVRRRKGEREGRRERMRKKYYPSVTRDPSSSK